MLFANKVDKDFQLTILPIDLPLQRRYALFEFGVLRLQIADSAFERQDIADELEYASYGGSAGCGLSVGRIVGAQ
jgi:hypothetical protein